MNAIDLLQPRHTYAPDTGEGHIYSPTALWTAAARMLHAGGNITQITDANLRPYEQKSDVVGVNVVGAPYIPDIRNKIQETLSYGTRLILGGAVINGLSHTQLVRLFGDNSVNGNDDRLISNSLVLDLPEPMQAPEQTSLIDVYERIGDEDMRKYMEHEMSFYLGQGCKFNCSFCAIPGRKLPERYRSADIVEKDLRYLAQRALKLTIPTLELYFSNVDLFQTPQRLAEFAGIAKRVLQEGQRTNPAFRLRTRGLATVSSFLDMHEVHPEIIHALVESGLHRVGFGIDGATPEVWKSVRKGHNTMPKCVDAVRIARKEYGLTPEVLMVFGHSKDTARSLRLAVEFTVGMNGLYGAVPRPHVAKDLIPNNDNWPLLENADRVELLLSHPEYFQALDFTALPSTISHRIAELRLAVERAARMIASIRGNITDIIYPIAPEFSDELNALHRLLNIGKYDN